MAVTVTEVSTDGALIALSGLNCTGDEERLVDCPHSGFGDHDCSHDQAAGLYCGCEFFLSTILIELAFILTIQAITKML